MDKVNNEVILEDLKINSTEMAEVTKSSAKMLMRVTNLKKKLKERDEQIKCIEKLNWIIQDQVQILNIEEP